MKPKTLLFFIYVSFNGLSQDHYTDTLPQLNVQNTIALQLAIFPDLAGIQYSRHVWSGMGYRNFEEVGVGIQYGVNEFDHLTDDPEFSPLLGPTVFVQHNHRLGLKRLMFITLNLAYNPKIPLVHSNSPLYDDYVNAGNVSLGMSFLIKIVRFDFHLGASVTETQQDLFYTTKAYAKFEPYVNVTLGISFGKKYD